MIAADPTAIEAFRLKLHAAGFAPLPLNGKKPFLDGWQRLGDATDHEIRRWTRTRPAETNTGILTRTSPAFDVDILDPEAASAVERLVRERYEETGVFSVRFGNLPKRAILFQTDEPFEKIWIDFITPSGEAEKLEVLANGQQLVVDGIHPDTKRPYSWFGPRPGEIERRDLPLTDKAQMQALLDDAAALLGRDFGYSRKKPQPKKKTPADGQAGGAPADWAIDFGDHDATAGLAMKLLKAGMSDGAVVNFLRAQVDGLTNIDPDREARRLKEIPGMVESARAKLDAEATPAEPSPTPTPLTEVVAAFEKWLLLEDSRPVYVTLGAIAANHLPGPPVWLGLIAPPSSAKTEILNATLRLSKVELVTTASPAALLSGTPKKQAAKAASGGLLRKVGSFGILVLKDFTSVLGLHRDNLSEMLDALREIYDGKWVRHLGTDGGKTLKWEGKLGLIFGCTEAFDSHYAVIGALGDRFLLYRLPASQPDQFEMAMLHTGERFKLMQDELAAAAAGLFAGLGDPLPTPRAMTDAESLRIKRKVILACQLRAGVDRDRYSREIEAVYGAEGPGRLGLALERLLAGLDVIGIDRESALKIVEKVALDSVPPIRRKVYEALAGGTQKTREVAAALDLPTTTARRALEDIASHGLATRQRVKTDEGKDGRDDEWTRVELAISAAALRGGPT